MQALKSNHWIKSPLYDSVFILLPPFLCLLLIIIFPNFFQNTTVSENEWFWLLLVVCVDVGHVYSTLYRTYMDRDTLSKRKVLFYSVPLLAYLSGVVLHLIDGLVFWRCLAYLAVFHFIRQQYGFMRLYSRHEENKIYRQIDTLTIYAACIYPLLHWHFNGPEAFNWFIDGDFFYLHSDTLSTISGILYCSILALYIGKEIHCGFTTGSLSIPKNLLVLGTITSWYFGIVYFRTDLSFTLLNIVSHGVPYYALVWAHGNKKSASPAVYKSGFLKTIFSPRYLLLFLGIVFVLAYLEEWIWDNAVWREHRTIFLAWPEFPDFSQHPVMMSLLVPLLTMPQMLHYIIDAFIWKIKKDSFGWFRELFQRNEVA
ncbi:MAG: hypothetical protein QM534_16195 [Sediminibacterium sp.]|nr:hypothetical protein [Sediminibacterium sp.]